MMPCAYTPFLQTPHYKALGSVFVTTFLAFSLAQTTLDTMQQNLEQGQYAEAAFITGPKLIGEQPDLAQAHYFYAYALYLINNHDQAQEQLELAKQRQEDAIPAPYHHLEGLLYAATGMFADAQSKLELAYSQEPSYSYAMDLGRIAWQAGDHQNALDAYQTALDLAIGPDQLWPYLNQGRIYQSLNQFNEAAQAYLNFTQLYETLSPRPEEASPAYIETYYRLGRLYEDSGDIQKAIEYYTIANINDPGYQPASAALTRLE